MMHLIQFINALNLQICSLQILKIRMERHIQCLLHYMKIAMKSRFITINVTTHVILYLTSYYNHNIKNELEVSLDYFTEDNDAPNTNEQLTKFSDMQITYIKDKDEKTHPMSFALYEDRYELSANHHLRREAFTSFTNTLKQYKHTFAATYATEVTKQVTMARVRGYDSV